jgi:hypothetical protein
MVLGQVGAQLPQHAHPGLDVAALRPPYLPLRRRGKVRQVAVLDSDEVGLAEGEVQVEVDQSHQCGLGVIGSGQHRVPALQKAGADSHQ